MPGTTETPSPVASQPPGPVATLPPESCHVGSSEAAALFNLSPHVTRFELYLRKRGELPERDLSANEAVRWRQYLEPAVGQGVADRMGWRVRKVRRYVTHPEIEGMGCSLGCEVVSHQRGAGVLEVETVDRLDFRSWENGRPPIHYELQLQHQLACTGRLWGALGILIGGNELRVVPYERHEGAIRRIEREVPIFWREVLEGRPPKPSYEADLRTLTTLYRHASRGSFLDLRSNDRARDLCAEYAAASEAERAARARRDAAKAEILELIGHAETIWIDGYRISAGTVAGGKVSYVREPYRSFRLTRFGRERNRPEEDLKTMPPPEPEPAVCDAGDGSAVNPHPATLDAFAAAATGEDGRPGEEAHEAAGSGGRPPSRAVPRPPY